MMKSRAIPILLALALLLSACSSLPRLSWDRGGYYNKKDGKHYIESSLSYVAARRQDKAVAILVRDGRDEELYPVDNVALATKEGELFIEIGASLPTLDAFAPDEVLLCREDVLRVELSRSSDAALLSDLVSSFAEEPPTDFIIPAPRYVLLLSSASYPDLFYRLEYRVDEESAPGLLYDRGQDLYVTAPAGLYDLFRGDM